MSNRDLYCWWLQAGSCLNEMSAFVIIFPYFFTTNSGLLFHPLEFIFLEKYLDLNNTKFYFGLKCLY